MRTSDLGLPSLFGTCQPNSRTAAVRTRMPGGVGGAAPRGVPIHRSIPRRKKTETRPRLSSKIKCSSGSNHSDQSMASKFFTSDEHRRDVLRIDQPHTYRLAAQPRQTGRDRGCNLVEVISLLMEDRVGPDLPDHKRTPLGENIGIEAPQF